MGRTKKAIAGTITSFVQYGVQILLQFLLAPLILKNCGQETMGAYAIVMQIIGYFSLADLGMNVSGIRYLAQSYNIDNNNKRYATILSFLRLFSVGSSILIGGAILSGLPFINSFVTLTESVSADFRQALIYYALWIIVKGFFWFYGSGLIASQDIAKFNIINIVSVVIKLFVSYFLVKFGFGLSGIIFAIISAEVVTGIMYYTRHKKLYANLNLRWKIVDKPLFKEVFTFGLNFFVINLATRLVLYTDNLIVGNLYGAAASSIYYLTIMPSTILNIAVMRISDSATPAINELFAKKQFETLRATYFKIHRITFALIVAISIGYIFFAKSLITVWVGIANYAGNATVLFCSLFGIVLTLVHIDIGIVIANGNVKILKRFAIFEAIFKITLSFVLGKYLGLSGVIVATFIANIPTSIYLFITSFKILNTSFKDYFFNVIISQIIPLATLTLLTVGYYLLEVTTLAGVILSFLVILIVYAILSWLFSINKEEKILIINLIMTRK